MKTILKKDINYYSESLDLLKLMTNDFSFEDLKNRLKRNYPLCNEYTSTVIDIISRIAAKVFSNLDFSKERLDFFFKDLNLNDLSIADILLLNQNRFLDISLEEQLTLIKNMSYKEKFITLPNFFLPMILQVQSLKILKLLLLRNLYLLYHH